jgi:hypothetical protein
VEVVISIDVMIGEIMIEINHRKEERKDNRPVNNNPELAPFLHTLTPGTCIVIQYDCQPPTKVLQHSKVFKETT